MTRRPLRDTKPATVTALQKVKNRLAKATPTRLCFADDRLQLISERKVVAQTTLAPVVAKPLLRWAGGKAWLSRAAKALMPPNFKGKFYEPFCGGAAFYCALGLNDAVLGDKNKELITTYRTVRDDAEGVIKLLRGYPHLESYFYKIRELVPRTNRHLAARFIYLNRTCWNGLYRVNSEGIFNTPFGSRDNPDLVDAPRLRAISTMMKGVSFVSGDFEKCVKAAQSGDWVYFDPPYITGHQNNGFLMYNAHLFAWADQERLATAAKNLVARGVNVLVSNADHSPVINLYKDFYYYRTTRNSLINGTISLRGKTTEALLSSYPLLGSTTEVIDGEG